MAPSLHLPGKGTSIELSSLQEQDSHDHAPLLGYGSEDSVTATSEERSASRPPRWQDDNLRFDNEDEATGALVSVSGKADSKEFSTGIAGVISVLTLGNYLSIRLWYSLSSVLCHTGWSGWVPCLRSWAGYRRIHRERRYLDRAGNVQHDCVGAGEYGECELACGIV